MFTGELEPTQTTMIRGKREYIYLELRASPSHSMKLARCEILVVYAAPASSPNNAARPPAPPASASAPPAAAPPAPAVAPNETISVVYFEIALL